MPNMSSIKPKLDKLRDRTECWIDLAFPLALCLLLAEKATLANALLTVWACSRIGIFANSIPPQSWGLIALATLNAGLIIQDAGGKPSDPSDLLIILLGFCAGIKRGERQWLSTSKSIALCLAPLAIYHLLGHEIEPLLRFPGINVNRLSFFLGISAISGFAAYRMTERKLEKLGWASLTSLAIPLGLATGSRASVAAPAIAIIAGLAIIHGETLFNPRKWITARYLAAPLALLAALALGAITALSWYTAPEHANENRTNDINRFATASCWFNAPLKKRNKALLGLGYNSAVRKHCNGDTLEEMRRIGLPKGLPHAHNVAGQIMGETGLLGLATLGSIAAWAASQILAMLNDATKTKDGAINLILPFCIYLAITGMTTSFHIYLMLNQVLIGYLLGSLVGTARSHRPAKRV